MNRPLKVLLLVFNPTGKGTYWRAFHWGRVLVRRGHEVTLMATDETARFFFQKEERAGVQVVHTPDLFRGPLRSGWDPWNALKRVCWLGGRKFDVVHAFENRPVVLLPSMWAKRHGAKLIMDWCDWFGRGGSVEERPNPLIRWILRPVETYFEEAHRYRADGHTVINTLLRDKAIRLGIPAEKILLIRNGSDPAIRPRPREEVRKEMGIPENRLLIGFVGGTYLRDARFMAAALDAIQARMEGVQLLLIGYFNRPLEDMVQRKDSVKRTGTVAYRRLFDCLAACDVCWLPLCDTGANRGRWPLKLNDYLVAGRPVVATDVGDLRATVLEQQIGLISEPDPAEFAEKTITLLGDEVKREMMERNARRAAETVFSWERLTESLERFYYSVDETPRTDEGRRNMKAGEGRKIF